MDRTGAVVARRAAAALALLSVILVLSAAAAAPASASYRTAASPAASPASVHDRVAASPAPKPALAGYRLAASPTPTPGSTEIPSVGLAPTESKPGDPNRGQWFVFSLAPGETGRTKVRMVNPGRVGQTVKMYGADLNFAADGTPSVNDGAQRDVGLWVAFEQASVWVPAMSAQEVPF
ncbi:MAG: hypothetical protein WDA71_11970, partial [Actinomycetota bacterium]